MPLIPVVMPQFPNVPFGLGVPTVLRAPGALDAPDPGTVLTEDAAGLGELSAPQWGVFDDQGNQVLQPDTLISMDARREARLSTAPVEEGGFQSYNKVAQPNDARVRMAIGGSADVRAAFVDALDALQDDLNIYSVVAPDAVYLNVNQVHYDFSRQRQNGGASMIVVDVWYEEVRQSSAATTENASPASSPKDPTGAASTNGGQVQAKTPPEQTSPPPQSVSTVSPSGTPGGSQGFAGVQGLPGTPSGPALRRATGQSATGQPASAAQ